MSSFHLNRTISLGRAEALEMLYATLKEEVGNALLYGEPRYGKSTPGAQVCL